jgi:hypothetical protein
MSLLSRLSGGEFLLDAASGPIAHPEKLAYAWFYILVRIESSFNGVAFLLGMGNFFLHCSRVGLPERAPDKVLRVPRITDLYK